MKTLKFRSFDCVTAVAARLGELTSGEDGALSALAGLERGRSRQGDLRRDGRQAYHQEHRQGVRVCNRRGPRRAPSEVSPASFPPEAH